MAARNVLQREMFYFDTLSSFQNLYFITFTGEVESVLLLFLRKNLYLYLSQGCVYFCHLCNFKHSHQNLYFHWLVCSSPWHNSRVMSNSRVMRDSRLSFLNPPGWSRDQRRLQPLIKQWHELAGLFHTMTLSALPASLVLAKEGDRSQCESADRSWVFQNVPTRSVSRATHTDRMMGEKRVCCQSSRVHFSNYTETMCQISQWAGSDNLIFYQVTMSAFSDFVASNQKIKCIWNLFKISNLYRYYFVSLYLDFMLLDSIYCGAKLFKLNWRFFHVKHFNLKEFYK